VVDWMFEVDWIIGSEIETSPVLITEDGAATGVEAETGTGAGSEDNEVCDGCATTAELELGVFVFVVKVLVVIVGVIVFETELDENKVFAVL